jgi:hypothetical protein
MLWLETRDGKWSVTVSHLMCKIIAQKSPPPIIRLPVPYCMEGSIVVARDRNKMFLLFQSKRFTRLKQSPVISAEY